jgi:hypothetical protein
MAILARETSWHLAPPESFATLNTEIRQNETPWSANLNPVSAKANRVSLNLEPCLRQSRTVFTPISNPFFSERELRGSPILLAVIGDAEPARARANMRA